MNIQMLRTIPLKGVSPAQTHSDSTTRRASSWIINERHARLWPRRGPACIATRWEETTGSAAQEETPHYFLHVAMKTHAEC